jgi:hypothetical protein|tara:strand:- start:122 stop:298 length:177 start_codon:yes stop_codon:yes gene_type:complete
MLGFVLVPLDGDDEKSFDGIRVGVSDNDGDKDNAILATVGLKDGDNEEATLLACALGD